MSRPRHQFTAAQDATIRAMRAAGRIWPDIADAIGMKETVTRRHAQRSLNIPGRAVGVTPDAAPIGDMQRDPLPPGHSATWTALTAGTVLAGEAYAP